jgi:hypothetical protein
MVKVGDTVKWSAGKQGMLSGKVTGGEKGKRWRIESKGKKYYVPKEDVKKGVVKKKKTVDKDLFLKVSQVLTENAKSQTWRGTPPKGLPPLPPPSSGFFYPLPDKDGDQNIGFVGKSYKDAETHPFFDKVKKIVMSKQGYFGYDIIGDKGSDKVDSQISRAIKKMKLSKEDAKKFTDWAKNLSKKIVYPTYQERAKEIFEAHKKFFGKDHYALVEIAGIGTVNWDGYTLYERGAFSRGDKIGTYKNEKDLDEWDGDSLAFSKYEPLELNQNAKGLRLTRIP